MSQAEVGGGSLGDRDSGDQSTIPDIPSPSLAGPDSLLPTLIQWRKRTDFFNYNIQQVSIQTSSKRRGERIPPILAETLTTPSAKLLQSIMIAIIATQQNERPL